MNEADWWIEEPASDRSEPEHGSRKFGWASLVLLGIPLPVGILFFLLRGH